MNSEQTTGVSVGTVIQIVLIVLKLFKLIEWSWWWVLAPTWISILLVLVLITIWYWANGSRTN